MNDSGKAKVKKDNVEDIEIDLSTVFVDVAIYDQQIWRIL